LREEPVDIIDFGCKFFEALDEVLRFNFILKCFNREKNGYKQNMLSIKQQKLKY